MGLSLQNQNYQDIPATNYIIKASKRFAPKHPPNNSRVAAAAASPQHSLVRFPLKTGVSSRGGSSQSMGDLGRLPWDFHGTSIWLSYKKRGSCLALNSDSTQLRPPQMLGLHDASTCSSTPGFTESNHNNHKSSYMLIHVLHAFSFVEFFQAPEHWMLVSRTHLG